MVSPDTPAKEDAPAVARLREAGAVLFGKTTTPEWGHIGVTESRRHGITRNPWNLERAAGGSSGGAGAALAAGMGPLALGSDSGGSCRTPASFCGVLGMKPSARTVSAWPPSSWAHLATPGPITRTALDMAEMLKVISGPDPRDPLARSGPTLMPDKWSNDLSGIGIGLSIGLGFGKIKSEVAGIVEKATKVLGSAGAKVMGIETGLDDPLNTYRTLFFGLMAQKVSLVPENRRDELEPLVIQLSSLGEPVSAADYVSALIRAAEYSRAMEAVFDQCDLLVSAATGVTPFPVGRSWPDEAKTANGKTGILVFIRSTSVASRA